MIVRCLEDDSNQFPGQYDVARIQTPVERMLKVLDICWRTLTQDGIELARTWPIDHVNMGMVCDHISSGSLALAHPCWNVSALWPFNMWRNPFKNTVLGWSFFKSHVEVVHAQYQPTCVHNQHFTLRTWHLITTLAHILDFVISCSCKCHLSVTGWVHHSMITLLTNESYSNCFVSHVL